MSHDKPDCMFELLICAKVSDKVLTQLQQQVQAYRRYSKGASIEALAKDFRLSKATMRKWIKHINELRVEANMRGIPIMPGGKPF